MREVLNMQWGPKEVGEIIGISQKIWVKNFNVKVKIFLSVKEANIALPV